MTYTNNVDSFYTDYAYFGSQADKNTQNYPLSIQANGDSGALLRFTSLGATSKSSVQDHWQLNGAKGSLSFSEVDENGKEQNRLFLRKGGNVGIGTTEVEARLHIVDTPSDASGKTLILGKTTDSHLRLGYHEDYSWIQSYGSRPLLINPLQNHVGINTLKPEHALDVTGDIRARGHIRATGDIGATGHIRAEGNMGATGDIRATGKIQGQNARPLQQQMVHRRILFGVAGQDAKEYTNELTTIVDVYGPFRNADNPYGYGVPPTQPNATRKYRLYVIYSDIMNQPEAKNQIATATHIQFSFLDETGGFVLRLPLTDGHKTTYRDAYSEFFAEERQGHASIGMRAAGLATGKPGSGKVAHIELQAWDFFE